MHKEKSFRNLINPDQIWIVIPSYSIDLAPVGNSVSAKSIGKLQLQSKFCLDKQDPENISLCVCVIKRQILLLRKSKLQQ